MNILNRVEEIISQLEKRKLSSTIEDSILIAFELRDYVNWIMLQHQTTNVRRNNGFAKDVLDKFEELCIEEGIDEDTRDSIKEKAIEKYFSSRMNEGKLSPKSIYEIENRIIDLQNMVGISELPLENKMQAFGGLDEFKNIYSQIRCSVVSVLGELKKEARQIMELVQSNDFIDNKTVFIIHGHNEAKWRELKTLLKDDFKLNPIILSEEPNKGLTIIEKFETYAQKCAYAFAIFTPDDIVVKDDETYFQARPNVIFELGWFYAKLGRSRICILSQDSEKSKIFSDLQGILRLQFNKSVREKYSEIKKELESIEK